jgi:putative flippase GtrA
MEQSQPKFKNAIAFALDLLYPFFKRFMSFEVYRYLAVGGICFFLNIIVFHVTFYYLSRIGSNENVFFNNNFKSLLASMSVTLPTGFLLTKYFVFKSSLSKDKQFLRYSLSTIMTVYLSKKILDFLIIDLHCQVTVSLLLSIAFIQAVNFFFQKKISFQ